MVIFNVKAQNTPIDDFLKKLSSREGVTHVSMSQQLLRDIFGPTNLNFPEAYSSVSISKTNISEKLFADFKNTLLTDNYEQIMEVNKENNNILYYFLKKESKKSRNELLVLRQQTETLSAIYIRCNFELDQLDEYLKIIQQALVRLKANNSEIYLHGNKFAFTMPSFNYNYLWNYKFDPEAFNFKMDEDVKQRMEESMKKVKEMMESGDFQRKFNDSMEEAQRQMEEKIKQMEEEQAEGL